MAKTAKEKSPAAKALEAAQDKLKKAKEQLARQDNAANKKAVAEASAEVKKHAETVNRERFEDVAGTRVAAAMKALKNLTNCASTRSYKFNADDVTKMEGALTGALKSAVTAFRNSLAAPAEGGKSSATNKFEF